MTSPLRLGIAGLGTVGTGTVKILQRQQALLTARTGRALDIRAICARSRSKDRGVRLSEYDWEDDPVSLAKRDDIDVFVELMGGSDGPALAATKAALSSGKDVVTANKALLATHGQQLAELAETHQATVRYEAAVAGGIPVIKALGESLAGNEITRVMGVMNGTCNYILTRMENAGLAYETVFAEANDLGYLEADPTLDVGGIDAAHKLALLASLAFGTKVNFEGIDIEGIEQVSITDIEQAAELGYRIKLLGVAQRTGRGLEQRMSPCLVPVGSSFGQLEGATNMVALDGDAVDRVVLSGPGAGEGPTASAVLGDIVDIARGNRPPVFSVPATELEEVPPASASVPAPFYLRLELVDKPGAMAKIAAILGENGVSIDRMRQKSHDQSTAPVLIVTHKAQRSDVDRAIQGIRETDVLVGDPVAIRIEAL